MTPTVADPDSEGHEYNMAALNDSSIDKATKSSTLNQCPVQIDQEWTALTARAPPSETRLERSRRSAGAPPKEPWGNP